MKKNPRIILITTTIYVPRVLERYHRMGGDVLCIIAGDKKTPHRDVRTFVKTMRNVEYLSVEDQEKLGYKSSSIIGWNKIMRRNIALLEALKHGADIVVSVDDDNIPLDEHYFEDFLAVLTKPYSGLTIQSPHAWINIGDFMSPHVYHRGFPYTYRHRDLAYTLKPAHNLTVGVAAGLWYGDPDIDAMERITNKPTVLSLSDIIYNGLVVAQPNFAPINSQNTAYVRELAPLFMVLVGVGRYDDIWGSYIAQRIMTTTRYHLHYGKPFVWQERNPQSHWTNLTDELFGMEYTPRFTQDLLAIKLPQNASIVEKLEILYQGLSKKSYLPSVVRELGTAWIGDIKSVLSRPS